MGGLKSTLASVIGGRLFIGVSRLLFSILIVRLSGAESFGAYILVTTFLFFGEWLVDFGTTDIGVRELARTRSERETVSEEVGHILVALLRLKLAQIVIAILVVNGAAFALGYRELQIAFLVGSVSFVFMGLAVAMRAYLRASMRMDRDVKAESLSLLVNLAALLMLAAPDSPVWLLVACHTISRGFYALFNLYFARGVLARLAGGPKTRDYHKLLVRSAMPLGIAGVIVVIYDAMYPVVLSKLLNLESVAIFTVALRLVAPVVIITQAIANVFFTLLVRAWEEGITAFEHRQRQFTLLVAVVACGLFTGMYVGAEFFVGLFGEEVDESAALLRVVAWALMGRVLTTAMAPPIVISGHQHKTLGLMVFTVVLSTLVVLALVPLYGVWGAAYAFVIVEVVLTGVPTAVLSQYWAGFRMHWWRLAAVMALAVLVTQGARAFESFGSLGLAIAAGLVFAASLFVTRVLRVRDIVELSAARGGG